LVGATGNRLAAGNADNLSALDGLRQEKFNLNLPTGPGFYLKPTRGNSQSTALLWNNHAAVSNFNLLQLRRNSPA
jgi:hypothetical protein